MTTGIWQKSSENQGAWRMWNVLVNEKIGQYVDFLAKSTCAALKNIDLVPETP
ncbi:hypothetical protein [Rivihabitans pingtungensis]|uniref:hypothetical protein n=1 Tax=Rivihabitans pingtungensis TaxID=1054498 RepID=UPI0023561CB0|nr:hypothetical protein [Rivihabitans pingtungensis]MCK6436972.1 hypothetical protein [Rivihabitans pingtungensis]